jgi:hypothetical protein
VALWPCIANNLREKTCGFLIVTRTHFLGGLHRCWNKMICNIY